MLARVKLRKSRHFIVYKYIVSSFIYISSLHLHRSHLLSIIFFDIASGLGELPFTFKADHANGVRSENYPTKFLSQSALVSHILILHPTFGTKL